MADVKWTTDQQKVIDLRNRNILVSAAAGSGKTAVLVQRIINIVTDVKHPVNIDRLLIVTFTKAAAAEMRERISAAIEKEIEKDPENQHLQKQTLLIHNAQITTIDSFCLNIVKNYFNEIDLNPGFRIADENELALLKADIVADVLESYYEKRDEAFLEFIEKYAMSKSDKNIENMILRLYNYSVSFPWSKEWLNNLMYNFNIETTADMEKCRWMNVIIEYIQNIAKDLAEQTENLLTICNEIDGPIQYMDNLLGDIEIYKEIYMCSSYEQLSVIFDEIKFSALSRKRSEASEYKKELVKSVRNKGKDKIKKIKEKYFFQSSEEVLNDIIASRDSMQVLVNLTMDFYDAFAKEKEERNIIDFGDMEHFALKILTKKNEDDGRTSATETAIKLSEYFEEILVDEYQDSNFVQEAIINSISKERDGRPNVFMVGDVKQSIYKFRMAKPELFMKKFDSYSLDDSIYQRIDLKKNFRSRKVVLDGINYIFEMIMAKKFGNIEYDELAALYPGADYPVEDERYSDSCELMMFDTSVPESGGEVTEDEEDLSKIEVEARIIASRIKELTDPETGLLIRGKDKDGNTISKTAEYRDISILLRGLTGWSEVLLDVFSNEGIPLFIESRTGYFSAIEVRTMLNMMRILNNPRQDIPLTAIALSPIGDFSNEDMAKLRASYPEGDIYSAISNASRDNNVKCINFLEKINYFRNMVSFTPIHELIKKVMIETGYYSYVYAMPDGERRRMNLDMLVEKAIKFESTSYKGLFNFIRSMERMDKYNIDMGEAGTTGGDDNYVKVMTIHKSKGLEFPVVFVAGMGKQFNNMDSREKILIHSDYGVAPDFVDSSLKIKSPTLIKSAIADMISRENIEEELRIFYVALTRAKEKLILTGGIKDIKKSIEKYSSILTINSKQFSYERLCGVMSYFDLVIPALMKHGDFKWLLEACEIESSYSKDITDSRWLVNVVNIRDTAEHEVIEQVNKIYDKNEVYNLNNDIVYDSELLEKLTKLKNYKYEYQNEVDIKGKISVSEIKKLGQLEEDEKELYQDNSVIDKENIEQYNREQYNNNSDIQSDNEMNRTIPRFIKSVATEKVTAAESGTAYHKVLELLDLDTDKKYESIKRQIDSMHIKGHLSDEQLSCISVNKILRFAESDIAKRIMCADKNGKVWREQPFVMAVSAREAGLAESNENILIQGIIDIYFEEEGEIILLDYKTDRVNDNYESVLKKRYSKQLEYYAKALERITGKKVRQKIIFALSIGKTVLI